jgi:hypothetical protein
MSRPRGLGFGAFLVGVGGGWLVFSNVQVSRNLFAWILITVGCTVVASSLFSRWRETRYLGSIVRGLAPGLILALLMTTGMGFTGEFSGLGDYRASTTRTLDGPLTEDRVLLDVQIFNGPIEVSTWDRNEYQFNALIRAKGITDAEAEENLDDFEFDLDETLVLGRRKLVLRHNVVQTRTSLYSVSLEVKLPADTVIDLDLRASNGGISLAEIEGGVFDLGTSNGRMTFDDVTASRIDAGTSNGGIYGILEAPDTSISTSNGKIELRLPCTASGRYVLRTSNAAVDLRVSSQLDVGYDLDMSTSNGAIDFDMPGLVYSVNQRTIKRARTEGFTGKSVQIIIEASTSNAGMDVDA